MSLPIISELKTLNKDEDSSCPGPSVCQTCPAYTAIDPNTGKTECVGCTTDYRDNVCSKASCNRQCGTCGGSGGSNDMTMAACGRPDSFRQIWYDELGGFSFDYKQVKPRPQLLLKDRFIPALWSPVNYAPLRDLPSKFPEVKAWACSGQDLFNKDGNPVSQDFKDFLGLAPDQKLLMTMLFMEQYVEMLWRRGDKGFEQFNVDYWSCLTASVHLDDCKFMQHFNSKRQLMYLAHANCHMMNYALGSVKTPRWYAPLAGVVQNVMLYTFAQFRFDPNTVKNYRNRLEAILNLDPGKTTIFLDMIVDKNSLSGLAGTALTARLERERYHILNKRWLVAAINSWTFLNDEDKKKYGNTPMLREERACYNLRYLLDMWGSYS